MPEYVSVVFNIPLKRDFLYRNPEGPAASVGCRVEAAFGRRKAIGWGIGSGDDCPIDSAKVKPWLRLIDDQPLFGPTSLALARWLAGMYFCSLGEALAIMLPSGKKEPASPAQAFDSVEIAAQAITASAEQQAALAYILSIPDGRCYLYGPTGTGKTEVFLQAAEATLAEGRGVIYLVPEIALTHQVIEAVRQRFGKQCAVLHSGLSPAKKLGEWRRILAGEARVVVGARSAVFAPLPKLGLIVLDEEHETSYKAGNTPRYHGRQVAMYRAVTENARLLMGSATPSVESWQAMEAGQLAKLSLSRRLAGGAMPSIEIVDMRLEGRTLSKRLIEAVRTVKAAGGQSILFLNRRGFAYFWSCKSCGAELKCRQCSVGLTYHKEKGRLICHYCGYSAEPPRSCPACGSLEAGWSGFGTERVAEEAAALFPDLSLARLDSDTVSHKGVLEHTLQEFKAGRIDLLLGTQMVAKGLNFPGVQLVGVILADTTLNLPDFRAAERAFALVTQVAGRAGRFNPGGRVIVQTYRPHSPVIRRAAAHDTVGFYADELAVRRELGFPPFARLIRIVLRAKEAEQADQAANQLAERLIRAGQAYGNAIEVLGPAECPIATLAGNARRQILLRGQLVSQIRQLLSHALTDFKLPSACYCEIDVDPVSLM